MKSFLRNKTAKIFIIIFYALIFAPQFLIAMVLQSEACRNGGMKNDIPDMIVGLISLILFIISLVLFCLMFKKKKALLSSMMTLYIAQLFSIFTGFFAALGLRSHEYFGTNFGLSIVFSFGGFIPFIANILFGIFYNKSLNGEKSYKGLIITFLVISVLTNLFFGFMNSVIVKGVFSNSGNVFDNGLLLACFEIIITFCVILINIFYGLHKFLKNEAPKVKKIKEPKPKKVKEPKPVKVKKPEPVKVKEPKPEKIKKVKEPKVKKIKEIKPKKVAALAATTASIDDTNASEQIKPEETPIAAEVKEAPIVVEPEVKVEDTKTEINTVENAVSIETTSTVVEENTPTVVETTPTPTQNQSVVTTNNGPIKILIKHANSSPKKRSVAFMWSFFLGAFGAHRFYVGKIGTGIFYLLTFGGFVFGNLCDQLLIIFKSFRDKEGRVLRDE